MKKLIASIFTAAVCTAVSAEVINLNQSEAWRQEARIFNLDGGIMRVVGGRTKLTLVNYPRLDRSKKYTISGQVRIAKDAAFSNFGIALEMLNDEERNIPPPAFVPVKDGYGVLVKDAKYGARTLVVKPENPALWKVSNSLQIAYLADKKLTDLPNRNLTGFIRKIESGKDGVITVHTRYQILQDLPAGTLLRLHSGSTGSTNLLYFSGLKHEWKKFSVTIYGTAPAGKFKGAAIPASPMVESINIVMSCNGSSGKAITEFKDLKLTIE